MTMRDDIVSSEEYRKKQVNELLLDIPWSGKPICKVSDLYPPPDDPMWEKLGTPVTEEEYESTVEVTEQDRSIHMCELVIVLRSNGEWTYGAFIHYVSKTPFMTIQIENKRKIQVRSTHVRVFKRQNHQDVIQCIQ